MQKKIYLIHIEKCNTAFKNGNWIFLEIFKELTEWNFFERRYIHKCEALMYCRPFVRQNE